jgi:hypothetical protein
MKRSILLASLAAAVVFGMLLPHAQAQMGPVQFNKSVTVDSSVAAPVGHAMSSHVMGDPTKLVPYSIRPATKPKSGRSRSDAWEIVQRSPTARSRDSSDRTAFSMSEFPTTNLPERTQLP